MKQTRRPLLPILVSFKDHGGGRIPYRTRQDLALGSVVSKMGTVVGWGWEGDSFVVHVV